MAGFPYRLVGGATRPDALNFDPRFGQALTALYMAAPPAVQRELALTSGYRSPEVQAKLYAASDKTGRTVAAPGRSKHQHGTAADLAGFGMKNSGSVSDLTRQWVRDNAEKHGLYFPMSYEPWHIQLRNGATPSTGTGQGGGVAGVLAGAVDPSAATMAMLQPNDPFKSITDAVPKRGGLVGEGSAGAGETADPGIPPLETASARITPDILGAAATPNMPGPQLKGLASLFKLKDIGAPQLPPGLLPPGGFA